MFRVNGAAIMVRYHVHTVMFRVNGAAISGTLPRAPPSWYATTCAAPRAPPSWYATTLQHEQYFNFFPYFRFV